MPSLPAPSPRPGNNDAVNIAIRTATECGSRVAVTDIADPVSLFSKDYDDNNGRVQDIASGEKRPASPRTKSAASIARVASPVRKKSNTSSSPPRIAFKVVARVAVAAIGAVGLSDIALPPTIARATTLAIARATSPTSVAHDSVFTTAPTTKRSSGPAMIGLVPKTQLLPWLRNPKPKTKLPIKTPAKMKSEIQIRRSNMLYHFSKAGKTINSTNNAGDVALETRPVTRSSVDDEEDWMIDLDAADCKVNETRRLSRYLLEHILTLPKNTPLLLLVRVGDDTKQFSRNTNKSSIINDAQQLPTRIIAGKEYFQFRCGDKRVKSTKISNKKVNPLMGKDVYQIGRDLLAEKDIVAIRAEAARRREKKSSVRACIMKSIHEMVNGLSFEMPNHLKTLPSWQQHVRSHPNNLGLK